MATVPSYVNWADGTVVHDANFNSQIRDAGNFLIGPPMCQAYSISGIASLATATFSSGLTLDGETFDNDNMHSTSVNPSRIIFQTLGWYDIQVYVGFGANATGMRVAMLRLNSAGSSVGGTFITDVGVAPGGASPAVSFTPSINITYQAVNVGDYLEIFALQSSGGALAVLGGQYNTGITVRWVHN